MICCCIVSRYIRMVCCNWDVYTKHLTLMYLTKISEVKGLICAMSYKRVFGAKTRNGASRKKPKRKYATFHALRFRLLFVVSLPGGAKGRQAKTRKSHHLAGFRVATFRAAMQIYDTFISGLFLPSICRVFAWRGERSPRENPPKSPLNTRLYDMAQISHHTEELQCTDEVIQLYVPV